MMELKLRDSSFAHCVYSNNPMPPKTFSNLVKWKRVDVGDKDTIYTDYHIQECDGGIAWLLEPYDLIPHIYNYVLDNKHKFKEIWSHDRGFIEAVNGVFVPFGGCWIDKNDHRVFTKLKDFSISLINSALSL